MPYKEDVAVPKLNQVIHCIKHSALCIHVNIAHVRPRGSHVEEDAGGVRRLEQSKGFFIELGGENEKTRHSHTQHLPNARAEPCWRELGFKQGDLVTVLPALGFKSLRSFREEWIYQIGDNQTEHTRTMSGKVAGIEAWLITQAAYCFEYARFRIITDNVLTVHDGRDCAQRYIGQSRNVPNCRSLHRQILTPQNRGVDESSLSPAIAFPSPCAHRLRF